MLRTYYYKNLFSHACNQVIGLVILLLYGYINYAGLIKFKYQYDIIHDVNDALSFTSFILILMFFGIQFIKGFLLYIPSTYLSFNDKGISFKKLKKEFQFINWEEIKLIELKIENEWMLNLFIEKYDGKIVRVVLSELWLLSLSRKLCVNHNFLKFIAIANINSVLMKKLDSEQVQDFYEYCGMSI